jgi:hypothetical protein
VVGQRDVETRRVPDLALQQAGPRREAKHPLVLLREKGGTHRWQRVSHHHGYGSEGGGDRGRTTGVDPVLLMST